MSPGDREKYRTRSPNDVDLAESKRRKDDKPPVHVSNKNQTRVMSYFRDPATGQ